MLKGFVDCSEVGENSPISRAEDNVAYNRLKENYHFPYSFFLLLTPHHTLHTINSEFDDSILELPQSSFSRDTAHENRCRCNIGTHFIRQNLSHNAEKAFKEETSIILQSYEKCTSTNKRIIWVFCV